MRIVLDTETTGLNPLQDEILQLAIIDADTGATIYNRHHKPQRVTSWEEAQKINRITPEDVEDCDAIIDHAGEILDIFAVADEIIGYNTGFDLAMLAAAIKDLPADLPYIDVMRLYAPLAGEWSEQYNSWKYKSLLHCAAHYGYNWGDYPAHDALNDAQATKYCYRKILDDLAAARDKTIEQLLLTAVMSVATAERINRERLDAALIFPAERYLLPPAWEFKRALEAVRDGTTEST